MNTISNERLEELRAMFSPSANKDVYLALGELLALRKERERAEPVGFVGRHKETGKFASWLYPEAPWLTDDKYEVLSAYITPPAPPVADESLPYDPQIAEYEQVMEAEQAQADITSQQFESLASVKQPSSNIAAMGKDSRDSDFNSSHDSQTTIKQSDGWKLVPIEPTKEMVAKMRYHNGGYDKYIKNGYAAMLLVAPEPCK